MSEMKKVSTNVLEKIVKLNECREGSTSGCNIQCFGLDCSTCPMNFNALRTLQQVRDELTARTSTEAPEVEPADEPIEGVTKPSHYAFFDGVEAIEVIARSMTVEMFRGYCMGNILKYRLRAGKKSELAYAEKDLAKANFYVELFEKHKGECYDCHE